MAAQHSAVQHHQHSTTHSGRAQCSTTQDSTQHSNHEHTSAPAATRAPQRTAAGAPRDPAPGQPASRPLPARQLQQRPEPEGALGGGPARCTRLPAAGRGIGRVVAEGSGERGWKGQQRMLAWADETCSHMWPVAAATVVCASQRRAGAEDGSSGTQAGLCEQACVQVLQRP